MSKDPRRLAVVIPCYNKVYYTIRTIESLIACTHAELYIILVDDASKDTTIDFARELQKTMGDHFLYHYCKENVGVNAAWNIGLRIAMATEAEHICIANNDLLFTDGWDLPLMDSLDYRDYSLVSPYSTEQSLPEDWPVGSTRHTNPVSKEMNILGACFMFHRHLIQLIGQFPEVCRHYYGDNWIADTTKEAGLKVGHISDSYIHHWFCITTSELDNNIWFLKDTDAYNLYKEGKKYKFSIGIRPDRQTDAYEKYLRPSIFAMTGNYNIVAVSGLNPAAAYNEMLAKCQTPYLILCHEDIVFTDDLLDTMQNTINLVPEFGVIGLVGPSSSGVNQWSSEADPVEVDSFDSCFIVIRKDNNIRFRSEIFDDYHLYVEDYCAMVRESGKKCYTIKLNPGSKIDHISATWHKEGPAWGKYNHYKAIFTQMWPNVKTT